MIILALECIYSTLHEPIVHTRRRDGSQRVDTLPEVLLALSTDDVVSFGHLMAHQTHAWHAFTVQLAALALHSAGRTEAVKTADDWQALLLNLTNGAIAPWCLVVNDLSLPAFLQPPVPEGNLSAFKNRMVTPDELDILITAKNHDVKAARIRTPSLDHWVFSLVVLQTMQGFLGAGNYGIVRMNGGFSNRACVAISPGTDLGARFARDVAVLLENRDLLVERQSLQQTGGVGLLWLKPWDGQARLAWSECDPFFIEICRRIRFTTETGTLRVFGAPTKDRRLDADVRKGDTGDPWMPVQRDKATALTVSGAGFTYKLLNELMTSDNYQRGVAQEIRPSERADATFYTWAFVRGQGVTEGLHERRVPLPPKVRARLAKKEDRQALGTVAKHRIDTVAKMQKDVLRPAICVLLQAAPNKLDLSDDRAKRWLESLDQAVDNNFFPALWADLELPVNDANANWEAWVFSCAQKELDNAIASVPLPSVARYRAIAEAQNVFHALKRKHFPSITTPQYGAKDA